LEAYLSVQKDFLQNHAGLNRPALPLAPQQAADITELAARAGWPVDLDGTWETFKDPGVLFVPSPGDPGVMLLFDKAIRRAVLVLEQGTEGYHLSVVDPSPEVPLTELVLGGDGYFGPEAGLQSLGLSDAMLASTQATVCQEACFKQPDRLGCAACTGVTVLVALRDPAAWDPDAGPEPTAVEEPSPTPEPAGSPQPAAEAQPQATPAGPAPESSPVSEPTAEQTPSTEPPPGSPQAEPTPAESPLPVPTPESVSGAGELPAAPTPDPTPSPSEDD
jgi:hypothetical protein